MCSNIEEKIMSLELDVACITKQELNLRFTKFDEADAWILGKILHEQAASQKLPMVLDIRIGIRPMFYFAMPGTTPENPDWVRRKFNTVLRFHKSSYLIGREYELRGAKFDASRGIDLLEYSNAGGSFPIHIIGTGVVGAVTVSGIPQRDDHNFVVHAIAKFLNVDLTEITLGPEKV
jgi:uncharacterized protein (UPF0303 family)